MNSTRNKRWVQVSHGVAEIDSFLVLMTQEIGRLDSRLTKENAKFVKLPQEKLQTIEMSISLSDLLMYSRFWILGAYELVRIVDKACSKNPALFKGQLHKEIKDLKVCFARIRMPLAKLEPAEKHKETDGPIAFPILHKDLGVGWKVSPETVITRQELSDQLLELLGNIRKLSI